MNTLARLWYSWCAAFHRTNAYLASHMDTHLDVAAHESTARQAERRLAILEIQG